MKKQEIRSDTRCIDEDAEEDEDEDIYGKDSIGIRSSAHSWHRFGASFSEKLATTDISHQKDP